MLKEGNDGKNQVGTRTPVQPDLAGRVSPAGVGILDLFLRAEWVEAMEAPGRPFNEGAAFTVFTLLSVVAAIFALWLYAAIRPRYGPGPSTALRAGVAHWVIGILLPTLVGVRLLRLPMRFLIAEVIAAFASFVAATVVAAWRYQE